MKNKALLNNLKNGATLSRIECREAFGRILSGEMSPIQMAGMLMAMALRQETPEELTGAVEAVRAQMVRFPAPDDAIDVCGTGGDGQQTPNVSTSVAVVVAACGVPVIKHGNRAVSSESGSADVLSALGVSVDSSPAQMERCLKETHLCFLRAPNYHPAMKVVAPVRQELGIRTLFNLIGPLCNPGLVKNQLIGVYGERWLLPVAETLRDLGSQRLWVVNSQDGLDEISITAPTRVTELMHGSIRSFLIAPEDAGLARAERIPHLTGGGEASARALQSLLEGALGPYRDIVLLNSAAALFICGKAPDLRAGVAQAAQAIDSGAAKKLLSQFITLSNQAA